MSKVFLFFILTTLCYCFEINSTKFDKKVLKNESVEKEFILRNSTKNHLKYTLQIEERGKNIQVQPKQLIIERGKEKKFKVIVKGEGDIGENFFHLLLKEDILNKNLAINKTFRIKQKYILGDI